MRACISPSGSSTIDFLALSTLSSRAVPLFRKPQTPTKYYTSRAVHPPSTAKETIRGDSGRQYEIEKTQELPFGKIYLATYVLLAPADIDNRTLSLDFDVRSSIYNRLGSHAHVRTPVDTVPARQMFVFEYLDETLLGFAERRISLALTKRILQCALHGLAGVHEADLVHNDVKPNNIVIQTKESANDVDVERVQLFDSEDSAHLLPGEGIVGAQLGNWMWRSPESHAYGPVRKPSDIFSFGVVCIYAMIQRVIFAVDESELSEGVDKPAVVLERQISYFADEDGLDGFLRYIGSDSDWHEIFLVIKSGFGEQQPRKPFGLWIGGGLDQAEDFKDLIGRLTDFDPKKRLTAPEALAHRWFSGVE